MHTHDTIIEVLTAQAPVAFSSILHISSIFKDREPMVQIVDFLTQHQKDGFDRTFLISGEKLSTCRVLVGVGVHFPTINQLETIKPILQALRTQNLAGNLSKFRDFFVDVEFVTFALLKLGPLREWGSYQFKDHSQSMRVKILKDEKLISKKTGDALSTVFQVRNAFFHTSIDLKRAKYGQTRLEESIDRFEAECLQILDELCGMYVPIQLKQFEFGDDQILI